MEKQPQTLKEILLSKRYIKMYLHVLIALFIGSFIYVTWRSTNILVFYLFELVGLDGVVSSWRALFDHIEIPYFVLYALPDLCWVYSFTIYLGVFSYTPIFKKWTQQALLFLPVFLGAGSEFGQLVNIVPGTFDWYDVAAYVGGYVLTLLCHIGCPFLN